MSETPVAPAETLAAAAAKVRRLAGKASEKAPTPWRIEFDPNDPYRDLHDVPVRHSGDDWISWSPDDGVRGSHELEVAAYIAAMHPTLGLLLADALEAAVPRSGRGCVNPHLLALATEILNEGEN